MKGTVAEFVVLLRLHYTMENFVSVGQFARRLRDVFGEDKRFRYFFHHIARLGGPNDESITIVSEQDQKQIEAYLWDASGLLRPRAKTKPTFAMLQREIHSSSGLLAG